MIQSGAKTPSLTAFASTTPPLNRDLFRKASVLIGCVALFAIFSVLASSFYQPSNLIDIMQQSSINAVIAVGMTLVIMARGIDLSVGSIVGLSSMVASDLMSHNIVLGIFAGLVVGVICGLVNGVLIAKLKLLDFIVTLGTLSVFRGAALIYTNGRPIYGLPEGFRAAFGGQSARRSHASHHGHRGRRPRLFPDPLHGARRTDRRCRRSWYRPLR